MNAFAQLHPALQHHVVNSFGWQSLRPLQEAAVAPLLAGHHALLLAPTAGGKTEAAIFPVLSRLLSEDWRGLSVLYVCPLRALLNNLDDRLRTYTELLGRRSAMWHGDVGQAPRRKLREEPPDILLTTPESIEAILMSPATDHRQFFANLRVVIVDEIHAFAGDDRGWHLAALLERLTRLCGREVQRIGLSATVGNPENLLDWLAGHCQGPRTVIGAELVAAAETEVTLDFVGNLDNAALVISRLHRGEKRLVFCDSRARVEQVAARLRGLGVTTFVSHSSLGRVHRREAEAGFRDCPEGVIIATSTLELGIDLGDLDRVIQIDAPATVASFLQRLGRTGRRPGKLRNCLFLATRPETLWQAAALLHLWEAGFVETTRPPPRPVHLLAQQVFALVLQEQGIARADWRRWLGRVPEFADLAPLVEQVIDHLLVNGLLFADQGVLGIGPEGERTLGCRHFIELCSIFAAPPLIAVRHGRDELGSVDQSTFVAGGEEPIILLLGGQSWQVRQVDWRRHTAQVVPAPEGGHSRWRGGSAELSFALCRAMHALLGAEDEPSRWSRRAGTAMAELRRDFAWAAGSLPVLMERGAARELWTFAGRRANWVIAEAIAEGTGLTVRPENLYVPLPNELDLDRLRTILAIAGTATPNLQWPALVAFLSDTLKFADCLPVPTLQEMVRARYGSAMPSGAMIPAPRHVQFDG